MPEETSELDTIPGEDHVTLVTCTPYGVNSHRLLVRGIRTEYVEEETEEEPTMQKLAKIDPVKIMIVGLAVLIIIIIIIYLVVRRKSRKKKNTEHKE